ncbi:bifunctional autolysin [Arabiibacter massiliensis]|uniref:bifunctional autolysin n=1 Tax=Arabiibacter massiliensis TaxID=1870985 RepID=UPI0009BC5958|nr:bifunctional autolysin [Arabiibacter massiliensis]
MRDRDQRLRWIEKLIGGSQQDAARANALVIPTVSGPMAIAFASIEEVVAADKVKPLAFLPREFCGVLHRGNELAPVVDAGGAGAEGDAAHVALVRGSGHLLGLRFSGMPYAVNLDEIEHAPLEIRFRQEFDPGVMPVLDVDAVVDALLELD